MYLGFMQVWLLHVQFTYKLKEMQMHTTFKK